MSNFYIGTAIGNMVDLSTLLSSEDALPIPDFKRWQDSTTLGNGTVRALGRPSASWYWCWISTVSRAALINYCLGKSSRVFIRTEDDPNTHNTAVYSGTLVWPDTDNLWDQEFRLNFIDLVMEAAT